MRTIEELKVLLTLTKVGENEYQGINYKTPWKRIFGGQVLGQSLHAAYHSVKVDRLAHSMHGYFILAGDIDVPIVYEVDKVRDGGSFSTRRVLAKQNGKTIFITAISFQKAQEGFDHQVPMPNVLPPEVLLPDIKQYEMLKDTDPKLYNRLTSIHPNAIEFRPVEQVNPERSSRPYRHVWIRAKGELNMDLPFQHQMMAYASDYNLLTTALLPHMEQVMRAPVFFASIDHAMWFHRPFKIDDWLLYATDSPSASGTRGISRGTIFDRTGNLVCSVVQEGLMREFRKK